jgi:site-specific recombinase XerD
MLAILRVTGLRRSEVVALNLTDFDPTTGELQVRCGKGRKARTVYLPKGLVLPYWIG